MTATLTLYADPGHAWLKVPEATIQALGIGDQISRYSYQAGGFVYLEEDRDLSIFLRATEAAGQPAPAIRTRNSNKRSTIRALPPYDPARLGRSPQGIEGERVEYGGHRYTLASNLGRRGWMVYRSDGARFRLPAAALRASVRVGGDA